MSFIKLTFRCIFSPRLFKVYNQAIDLTAENKNYQPRRLESWGDAVISTVNAIFSYGLYSTPFICIYFIVKGFITIDQAKTLTHIVTAVGCIMLSSYIIRAVGRASNPTYIEFLNALNGPCNDHKKHLDTIRKYDFEFNAWPTTFQMATNSNRWSSVEVLHNNPFISSSSKDLPIYKRVPIQILAFIATHTFAMSLIYPGTLQILYLVLGQQLLEGRESLVQEHKGQRAKIKTADLNSIDTMFVDRRNHSIDGHTLFICSEGNAAFYEVGIMTTPIKAGYSTLGWNHPGFGWSTGFPYPRQEQNAIDAVIQYAIQKLGFNINQIVMYGWSIGCYSVTWAAVQYPEIKGLVLDAPFDDLMPLAKKTMPQSWAPLVREVVRTYVNLDVGELLLKYTGAVHIVRRTHDEVICIEEGRIATNRANNLVIKLILERHPEMNDSKYVGALLKHIALVDGERDHIQKTTSSYEVKNSLDKISKYMKDFKGSHGLPLSEQALKDMIKNL